MGSVGFIFPSFRFHKEKGAVSLNYSRVSVQELLFVQKCFNYRLQETALNLFKCLYC